MFHFCEKAFIQGTLSITVETLLPFESSLLDKIIIGNTANRFKPEMGADFKLLLRQKHEFMLIGNLLFVKIII